MPSKKQNLVKYSIVLSLLLCSFFLLGITENKQAHKEYNLSTEQVEPPKTSLDVKKMEEKAIVNAVSTTYEVPTIDTTFKAYMDYRTITDKSSKQWEMQRQAYTNEDGIRKLDDYYMVAMGVFYAEECGKRFKITFDNNSTIEVIVADIKKPIHCDETNKYVPMKNGNGNLLEFIVDTKILSRKIKRLGDVSPLGFIGNIIKIEEIIDEATIYC